MLNQIKFEQAWAGSSLACREANLSQTLGHTGFSQMMHSFNSARCDILNCS